MKQLPEIYEKKRKEKKLAETKLSVLATPPPIQANCVNFYGNEDDYFIQFLRPYLYTVVTTECRLHTCPSPRHTYTSFTTNLGYPAHHLNNIIFSDSLHSWLYLNVSQCHRKFNCKPLKHNAYIGDVILDDQGNPQTWHCTGYRDCVNDGRILVNLRDVFIFSADLLSRGGVLKLSQVPQSIVLQGKIFNLFGATLWNGSHYIGIFKLNNGWILYDGLKEQQCRKTGISFSQAMFNEPQGFLLSYLVFCV